MTEQLIRRVKNSLNKQYYSMNDAWLTDCIEFYLQDHENPADDEVITFVINQWLLCDLREMNYENGCLPKNLANQKCVKLPGKYILQMDKLYDISQSKYKQLEKIRNVSSENVEATEKENKQDDKTQNWEPKAKRMLQLFLTDGVQDILAIEYKPIRFLKDSLYPGFKLLIKGPVMCRKGVILLEETNISEVGGEVDTLLIPNAVENVFARALNLKENPDPYNDNKQTQNTVSTQRTTQMEEDFDINTEVIDQIDKQVQQQNSTRSRPVTISQMNHQPKPTNEFNSNAISANQSKLSTLHSSNFSSLLGQSDSQSISSSYTNKTQHQTYNHKIENKKTTLDDDDDLFLDMVDEQALVNLPSSKPKAIVKSVTYNQPNSTRSISNNNDDFPMDDETYDLTEQSPYFSTTNKQNENNKPKLNLISKPISVKSVKNNQENLFKSENANTTKYDSKGTSCSTSKELDLVSKYTSIEKSITISANKNLINKQPSPVKQKVNLTPSVSHMSEFPDDDFDMKDFDIKPDEFTKYYDNNKSKVISAKPIQTSNSKTNEKIKHSNTFNSKDKAEPAKESKFKVYNSIENFETEFGNEFNTEFNVPMDIDDIPSSNENKKNETSKFHKTNYTSMPMHNNQMEDITSIESTGTKRLVSVRSPVEEAPQKMRCLQSTPKEKSSNRKITDFLNKVSKSESQENKSTISKSQENQEVSLLTEDTPTICEFIKDVLKDSLKGKEIYTIVRGKVKDIIKLNLLKEENRNYFHLEGTITDDTGNLDIVFSSKVLETIIGYSAEDFIHKRKQSKSNPAIKDALREDLKKAQETLRVLDAFMEIKYKINERAVVLKIKKLSKDEKKYVDLRTSLFKDK